MSTWIEKDNKKLLLEFMKYLIKIDLVCKDHIEDFKKDIDKFLKEREVK